MIKILDKNTINKIAAGEVIENPASVVKELVENSIDAGSSAIAIEITDGGISRIRVTDNGCGIPMEDVKTAFLNHATSKISDVNDIFNINSLGFRGEALASIASVSQIEILTKPSNEIVGSRLYIYGGEIKSEEEIGCPNGTTIIVKNIFFNTPARHKFLKKPSTESNHILDIVNKIALGHPNISFKFINNNKVVLSTSGNNKLKNVALNIYGKDIIPKLIEMEYSKYEFCIDGLLGKPELSRANRIYENLFLNGRYIKSDLIRDAVEDAYKTRVMVGKFPMYILNLKLPPFEYDVNVHPRKLEVRFENEDKIYDLVHSGVLNALNSQNLIPEISVGKQKKETVNIKSEYLPEPFEIKNENSQDLKTETNTDSIFKIYGKVFENKNEFDCTKIENEKPEIEFKSDSVSDIRIEDTDTSISKQLKDYKIVGNIFGTYWIVEKDKDVYIIDQHAAHERILYEKFIKLYSSENMNSQILLTPLILKLTFQEKQLLIENIDMFKRLGFELEDFGESDYILRSVPIIFENPESTEFFKDILDCIKKDSDNMSIELKLDKIASISCRAAVKAHNRLTEIEVNRLIDDLMSLENPFSCPHGRPTIVKMTKREIEKKFKRIL